MKNFMILALLTLILSVNFQLKSQAEPQSDNGWVTGVNALQTDVFFSCNPANVKEGGTPDLWITRLKYAQVGQQCSNLAQPFIDFITQPSKDQATLQSQTSACLKCCTIFDLSAKAGEKVNGNKQNIHANKLCLKYCECACALKAFPDPAKRSSIVADWCKGPKQKSKTTKLKNSG